VTTTLNAPAALTSTTIGLFFLVLLFCAALWLLRRSHHPGVRNGAMQIAERHVIGPGQQLMIVRVGGQTLLLGVCAQSVNLLSTLDAELLEDQALQRHSDPIASIGATGLERWRSRWAKS
jgi:flagellar biosynthetic protein FliO